MNANRLTEKSQEALAAAQNVAARYGHTELDGEHLLLALLDQEGGLVPRLFQKMDVPLDGFRARLDESLQRRPKVSGPGAEPGKVYVTQRLSRLMAEAEQEAGRLKDEYVSVEHLLLPFFQEGTKSDAGRILGEFQVTRDRFLEALTEVRGKQRVTSASPEQTYEALQKYGRSAARSASCRVAPRTTRC
jgi:ATP-dependent Clp protease ATP-binding subunit ClpB